MNHSTKIHGFDFDGLKEIYEKNQIASKGYKSNIPDIFDEYIFFSNKEKYFLNMLKIPYNTGLQSQEIIDMLKEKYGLEIEVI